MRHTIDFKDGIILVRTSGEMSIQGFIAYISDVLKHQQWAPGGRILVDHRALEGFNMNTPDILEKALQVAAFMKDNEERAGRMSIACVVPDADASAVTSLWNSLREQLNVELDYRNFFDPSEGEEWLRSL